MVLSCRCRYAQSLLLWLQFSLSDNWALLKGSFANNSLRLDIWIWFKCKICVK
jgi:hypothetical protein